MLNVNLLRLRADPAISVIKCQWPPIADQSIQSLNAVTSMQF